MSSFTKESCPKFNLYNLSSLKFNQIQNATKEYINFKAQVVNIFIEQSCVDVVFKDVSKSNLILAFLCLLFLKHYHFKPNFRRQFNVQSITI